VPTIYPKCNPTEMVGLLVLLDSHKGSEDVALLARDLDLEIDEILPALEYSEVLGLVQVVDGRATFSDIGRKFVAASIRERKALLRDLLKRTTLFRTLLRALENHPDRRLTDDELAQIFSLTTARADDAVQNIVNWGRYADLFRYDSEAHSLIPTRRPSAPKGGGGRTPPSTTPTPSTSGSALKKPPTGSPPESARPAPVAAVT